MPAVCVRTLMRLVNMILLLLPVATAIADDAFELSEVVVTGTRTEKALLESPVRTEVVTRREIERTHARDLKEALEDVPGLVLRNIHGKSGSAVWLQGLDSDRVLVVVNGEPITPSTGSTVDLSQIGVADIERIEIVKGATSALYGSAAMGGVINVITRKPEEPLSYRLSIDGGSWGDKNLNGDEADVARRHLSGKLAVKRELWYLDFSGNLRDSDGYDLDSTTFASEGERGHKANLNTRLAWTPDAQTEIFFAPRYYQEEISSRFTTFTPGVGDIAKKKNEEAERLHATFGVEHSRDNGSRLRGWLVYDNWRDITQQDVVLTPQVEQQRDAEIDLYRAELQWDKPWGDAHLITGGLVIGHASLLQHKRENGVRVDEVSDKSNRNIEAYLQDDIFPGDHWELVPGIRLQDDSDFGFHAAPKINVMYTSDRLDGIITNVRLGYGNGYRVPNLKERYFVFDHSALGYMVLGNAALQPESSSSYQLGIEFARPGDFHVDISLFHNRIKDLIDTDLNPVKSAAQGLQIFDYQNIAQAITQGAELSSRYHVTPHIKVKGSYTFLDSEDRNTRKVLTTRPEHQIKLGFDYERKEWGSIFTLRSIYQSEEFVDSQNLIESPSWNTWDVKFTQTVSKSVKAFAGVDNITDEHRNPRNSGRDFRPKEGRYLYLGMSIEK